jgi:hypothetical protein
MNERPRVSTRHPPHPAFTGRHEQIRFGRAPPRNDASVWTCLQSPGRRDDVKASTIWSLARSSLPIHPAPWSVSTCSRHFTKTGADWSLTNRSTRFVLTTTPQH